ncbi:MAG: hypothetical protein KC586_20035, partial [Myxococcales bacterium]|nr:hypothetical protein [Myxococcales bacterium]
SEVLPVELFVGERVTTSPDGSVPYGPPAPTVARRVYDADHHRVLEDVFYDGSLHRTTLELDLAASSCSATDEASSFEGTIHFRGDDPFRWESWTYDLRMSDGSGTITGEGARSAEGFHSTKTFSAGGEPRARIRETFRQVEQAEFDEALRALEASAEHPDP